MVSLGSPITAESNLYCAEPSKYCNNQIILMGKGWDHVSVESSSLSGGLSHCWFVYYHFVINVVVII